MNGSVDTMRGGRMIVCVYVRACVRHRACLRMRAREPTAGMIWRMQTRAYVDVGAGVGVELGTAVLHRTLTHSARP